MSKHTVFKAQFAGLRTGKKGQTITLLLPKGENDINLVAELMKYEGRPVEFALRVDMIKSEEIDNRITEEQRKAAYKLINELGKHFGYSVEESKEVLKIQFCNESDMQDFSLSDCSKEIATNFIDWLIKTSQEEGINVDSWIKNESERLNEISLITKKCIVCGMSGEIHHLKIIGMGRNRKTVDDSDYPKVCLCRSCHQTLHQIGYIAFNDKFHTNLQGG